MTTRRALAGLGLVATGWIAVLAGVMLASDTAPAALVILPSATFLSDLPDAAILSRTAVSVTISDPGAHLALRAYHAGAMLVLPAGLTGCLGWLVR
jgi:hypothetical protein